MLRRFSSAPKIQALTSPPGTFAKMASFESRSHDSKATPLSSPSGRSMAETAYRTRRAGRTTHHTPHLPAPGHLDTSLPGIVRKYLQTYGLMPPRVQSYENQEKRCLAQLRSKPTDLDRFLHLSTLRQNNVHVFYRLLVDHLHELTPMIYTPTVGEACERWSEIYQQAEGMYLSFEDRGRIASVIQNWPQPNVEITVVTDGSRILGLGDLGVNGMGIPIGKLALYTACAGIRPERTLPLTVDLGTSTKSIREDPLYLGSRRDKVTPEEEQEFLDELMIALKERWPDIVIQYEDWKNPFPSLARYRRHYAMFNDDIQGTGAVIMGGVIVAVKQSGTAPKDHRAVFLGAGSAGVGVAKQIVEYFMHEGLTEDEARGCFYLVDSKGLITEDRGDKLADHKVYFARKDNKGQQFKTLPEVIEHVKPTILMGLSTIGGAFTPEILTKMGQWNEKPIVFPLSNPSSKSECTFEDAVVHTQGRALFASGSPFEPFDYRPDAALPARTLHPGQGNNMYVFPGIGLGTILSKAISVTDGMIYASGEALSTCLNADEISKDCLYPAVTRIRKVSVTVTRYVIRAAQRDNVDRLQHLRDKTDEELDCWIRSKMYDPHAETKMLEDEVQAMASEISPMPSPARTR